MNGGDSDADSIIYEWRNNFFVEFQRLPSHGAEDAEFFQIGTRFFLAIASIRAGRGPYDLNTRSVLYEWRGDRFVAFQEFASIAAKQWRYFTFDNRRFLALAQGAASESTSGPGKGYSVIFEWTGVSFEAFQKVRSSWAYNWEFFQLEGAPCLALADHARSSMIYRWGGKSFQPLQSFGAGGGRAFLYFEVDHEAYLAFANLDHDSALYRWDGRQFTFYQSLEGSGARAFAMISGRLGLYLVRVNFIKGSREAPLTALNSQLYRWERGELRLIEQFATFGGTDAAPFKVGGQIFIAVSNSLSKDVRFRVDSIVYRFMG